MLRRPIVATSSRAPRRALRGRSSSPKWISSLPALTRTGRPVSRSAAPRARSASAGSTLCRGPRLAGGAAVLRRLLRGPHGHPVADDALREPLARVVIGHREHGARVAFGQLAARDHPEHLLRQLEQAQPVRDRRLRAADAVGDLAERELELVDERRRRRAPPRPARAARGRRSRPARAGASRGRPRRARAPAASQARFPRGAPAAFAGDQLVAARLPRPHDDRLQEALLLDRARRGPMSPRARSGGAAGAGSAWIASTGSSSELRRACRRRRSGLRDRGRDRGAWDSAPLDKLHRHLPVRLRPGGAPVVRDRGRPWLGASARRTERGTVVVKTRSPKCRRTSASTWAASRVRPSTIVSRMPASASFGFRRALHELDRAEQLRQPLERVVLGLHRHDHAVGGGERVHGQRAERRRAVEEHEAVALARARERARPGSARRRRAARAPRPRPRGRACAGTSSRFAKAGRPGDLARAERRRAGRSSRRRSPSRRAPRWRSPGGRGRRAAPARRPPRGRPRG